MSTQDAFRRGSLDRIAVEKSRTIDRIESLVNSFSGSFLDLDYAEKFGRVTVPFIADWGAGPYDGLGRVVGARSEWGAVKLRVIPQDGRGDMMPKTAVDIGRRKLMESDIGSLRDVERLIEAVRDAEIDRSNERLYEPRS